jgi:predicted lipase
MRSSIWLLVVAANGSNIQSHLADSFPSIEETLEMAQLSRVVYHFKRQNETYCASFNELPHVHCEWYHHDIDLGTQVMLVSNSRKKYLAVVFAGTDDFRTSLLDADLLMKPFGDNDTVHLEDPMIKVHEGFDNAVFNHALWNEISSRLEHLIRKYRRYRLWTTGHSLGAAAALFTATALAKQGHTVTSINFGCPQTGNEAWRDYFNATSPLKDRLGVWRVVQGWDLVPRLPSEFFSHIGHTIQIWSENHHKYDKHSPNQIEAYYQHIVSYVGAGILRPLGRVDWLSSCID